VVDFSVNVNPFGPTPRVRDAVLAAPIHQYPDPESWLVRRALGARFDRPPEEIAVGNGACELLWTLAKLLHRPGDIAITVDPTFSEYAAAARSAGAAVYSVRADETTHFAFPAEQLIRQAKARKANSVYLCCPTSPLGQLIETDVLRVVAQQIYPCRLIVDESFLSLSEEAKDRIPLTGKNIINVRSLTKELGTPGVRIGYLMAEAKTVAGLDEHRAKWTVSSAAQAATVASLGDDEALAISRVRLSKLRTRLFSLLASHRFRPFSSDANYLTARSPVPVPLLQARLLTEHQIMVRDCASFGLPRCARFAVRPEHELSLLDAALSHVLGGNEP